MGNKHSKILLTQECSICYDSKCNGILLKCKHQFCTECLYNIIKTKIMKQKYISCPLCYNKIMIKHIYKLFKHNIFISKLDPSFIARNDIINQNKINSRKIKLFGPVGVNPKNKMYFLSEDFNYINKSIYVKSNLLTGMINLYDTFFDTKMNKKMIIKYDETFGPFNICIQGKTNSLFAWKIILGKIQVKLNNKFYKNVIFRNMNLFVEDASKIIIYNQYTGEYCTGGFDFMKNNKKIKWHAIFQPLIYYDNINIYNVNRLIGIIITNSFE